MKNFTGIVHYKRKKNCIICNKEFNAANNARGKKEAKYCSKICRQKNYNKKRSAQTIEKLKLENDMYKIFLQLLKKCIIDIENKNFNQ